MRPWCRSREEQTDAGADTARPGERESEVLMMINDTPINRKVSSPYLPQYRYR